MVGQCTVALSGQDNGRVNLVNQYSSSLRSFVKFHSVIFDIEILPVCLYEQCIYKVFSPSTLQMVSVNNPARTTGQMAERLGNRAINQKVAG